MFVEMVELVSIGGRVTIRKELIFNQVWQGMLFSTLLIFPATFVIVGGPVSF